MLSYWPLKEGEFIHGDEFPFEMEFKQLLNNSLYTLSALYSLG